MRLLALFLHAGFQQETVFLDVFAFQHVRQLLLGVVRIEIGEEAEIAAVDADHLDVVTRQHARGAEHVAVAADHHRQIGLLADFRQAAGFDGSSSCKLSSWAICCSTITS